MLSCAFLPCFPTFFCVLGLRFSACPSERPSNLLQPAPAPRRPRSAFSAWRRPRRPVRERPRQATPPFFLERHRRQAPARALGLSPRLARNRRRLAWTFGPGTPRRILPRRYRLRPRPLLDRLQRPPHPRRRPRLDAQRNRLRLSRPGIQESKNQFLDGLGLADWASKGRGERGSGPPSPPTPSATPPATTARQVRKRPRQATPPFFPGNATGDDRPRASSARRPASRATVAAWPRLSAPYFKKDRRQPIGARIRKPTFRLTPPTLSCVFTVAFSACSSESPLNLLQPAPAPRRPRSAFSDRRRPRRRPHRLRPRRRPSARCCNVRARRRRPFFLERATGDDRPRASSTWCPGSRATVAASPGLSGLERLAASSRAATGYHVRRILDDGLGLADWASKGRGGRGSGPPSTPTPPATPPATTAPPGAGKSAPGDAALFSWKRHRRQAPARFLGLSPRLAGNRRRLAWTFGPGTPRRILPRRYRLRPRPLLYRLQRPPHPRRRPRPRRPTQPATPLSSRNPGIQNPIPRIAPTSPQCSQGTQNTRTPRAPRIRRPRRRPRAPCSRPPPRHVHPPQCSFPTAD